jgi:hypothetical protein
MKYLRNTIKIASVIVGLAIPMTAAFAGQGTLSTSDLSVLSGQWWQWALSIPTSVNPVSDATGEYCMVGQQGSIWYLAGNFTGAPAVTRACSVPGDAALFFPVINNVQFDSPNLCGQGNESFSVKQLRENIKSFVDDAYGISVKVDGRSVKKDLIVRFKSPQFWTALPADNFFGGSPSCPAGIYSPSVSDGYYLALNPMKPGAHTIHIQAQSVSNGSPFTIDVTYNLTVVPVSEK